MWAVLAQSVLRLNDPELCRVHDSMFRSSFAQCMFGGHRPKQLSISCTHEHFQSLQRACDASHAHAPFAAMTAEPAARAQLELPGPLCEAICQRLAPGRALVPPRSTIRQSRKHAQLIPEFRTIVRALKAPTLPSKLLPLEPPGVGSGSGGYGQRFGIYHTPAQFIQAALRIEHPFDSKAMLPDALKRNVFELLSQGVNYVARVRLRTMHMVNKLKQELQGEESRFKSSLPLHAQTVLRGKNVLLWRHLLGLTEFPDLGVQDLLLGVDLVGQHDASPLFPQQLVQATTTPELLMKSAKWLRGVVTSKKIHAEDVALTQTVWEVTMTEVEKGFVAGPFESEAEVRQALETSEFVCSRRFAIMQSAGGVPKPRIIDDLKSSCVNSAFTQVDKLTLHDVDFLSSLACLIGEQMVRPGGLEIGLASGEVLQGERHQDFEQRFEWLGRCLDLSKAYKQVPVSKESLKYAVLVATRPADGKPVYFLSQSLPFGACAAVYSFNRISRSLWHLSTHLCKTLGGVFYDDFPLLEPACSGRMASASFQHLLDALGWLYAKGDDAKCRPFEACFDVLGVAFCPQHLSRGVLGIENKASRVERLRNLLAEKAHTGSLTRHEASSVHGMLNFMTGFVAGKSMKIACLGFSLAANGRPLLPRDVRDLCRFTSQLLDKVARRVVDCSGCKVPVLIFTDAAFEEGKATWGAVALDPQSGLREVAGGEVPTSLVAQWQENGGEQVIAQAETFACLLARVHYRNLIAKRRTIFFVDNEACRFSLIRGSSRSRSMLQLVQEFHNAGEDDLSISWIERVPSASNPADAPSRGVPQEAAQVVGGACVDASASVKILVQKLQAGMEVPRILASGSCCRVKVDSVDFVRS